MAGNTQEEEVTAPDLLHKFQAMFSLVRIMLLTQTELA